MKRFSFVMLFTVWIPAILTAEPAIPDVSTSPTHDCELIVKTRDFSALEGFAYMYGITVRPLINYPSPSPQTLDAAGDLYIARIENGENDLLEALKNVSGVELVEPNAMLYLDKGWDASPEDINMNLDTPLPYTPNDPRYSEQWDKPITETNTAWNTTKGEDVTIAFIDTGVDTTHEDLKENLVAGRNFALGNTDVSDHIGHGTSVLGVAAAKMDNAKGIAGTAGQASAMMLRIADSAGAMYLSWAVEAIYFAADNGAKVISMSIEGPSYFPMEDAVNNVWGRGLFICAGVGNSGDTNVLYPAAYDKVMGVGASNASDNRWSSSRYGSKVDIFAPGGLSTSLGGGYAGVQATSFTTPQIAALAALIWSAHPEYSSQQIWNAIIEGADTIDSDVGKILRMNSSQALAAEVGVEDLVKHDHTFPLAPSVGNGRIVFRDLEPSCAYSLTLYDVSGSRAFSTNGATGGTIVIEPAIPGGVYFYRLETGGLSCSGKFVFVK